MPEDLDANGKRAREKHEQEKVPEGSEEASPLHRSSRPLVNSRGIFRENDILVGETLNLLVRWAAKGRLPR